MVEVRIDDSLVKKLERRFNKKELRELKQVFLSLQDNPFQGDLVFAFGNFVLKEKKYKSFRFYFFHSRKIRIIKDVEKLRDEIIKFIDMSKKNGQQNSINKLKEMLKSIWGNKK